MFDSKSIESMAKQLSQALPSGLKSGASQVEGHIKLTLQKQLEKLDFVSRDEFEIQQKMLLKLRERVEVLTQELERLQAREKAPIDS
jgi:BMFP domain-containing protein YqiC